VRYCFGASCFPELGADADTIYDLSRLISPKATGGRLLILSDSFGAAIVPWFAPYFSLVTHYSLSNLDRLPIERRVTFLKNIFGFPSPDVVLYVFHDGSIHYWPELARRALVY
jgi:hypothetical protein